jgi:hypothetical protein
MVKGKINISSVQLKLINDFKGELLGNFCLIFNNFNFFVF